MDKFVGIKDNFIFKLSIFYNKYQLVALILDAYLENISIILIGQANTHFYSNWKFIVLFNDFCQKIQFFFEGPE